MKTARYFAVGLAMVPCLALALRQLARKRIPSCDAKRNTQSFCIRVMQNNYKLFNSFGRADFELSCY